MEDLKIKNICETIKPGRICTFWLNKKGFKGCTFGAGSCKPVVDACSGCSSKEELPGGSYCLFYADPEVSWTKGNCPKATHIIKEVKEVKIVNALKASKRAAKGK